MRNISLINVLYYLLFPMILVYPHNLFEGLYLNYVYVVVVSVIFILFDKNRRFSRGLFEPFFLGLFLVVGAANLISEIYHPLWPTASYLSSSFRYLSFFLVSLVICCTSTSKERVLFWLRSFYFTLAVSLTIIFLDANKSMVIQRLYRVVSFESLNTSDIYFRAYGAFLSPISAGIFLLNSFILSVSLYVSKVFKARKYNLFLLVVSVASIAGIVVTGSRTSLVGLLVSFSLLIIITKRIRLFFLIFILLFITYQETSFIRPFIENIEVRNENNTKYTSNILEGTGRLSTYENAIRLFFGPRTFFTGVGPTEYNYGDNIFSYAHNGFLSLILCYGFIGLLLFVALFRGVYKKVQNILARGRSEVAVFFQIFFWIYLITNCVTFISSDGPVTYFWILFLVLFVWIFRTFNLLQSNQ